MCGRVSVTTPAQSIAEFFLALSFRDFKPSFNIAPTQVLPIIRAEESPGNRLLEPMMWGLIPPWAKDLRIASKLANARCETLAEKPSFRAAFKYRRCLVILDGFYEWKTEGKRKRPFFFYHPEGHPLAVAGLWEHWSGPDGQELRTCTIITCDANQLMAPVHHRMPVILATKDHEQWLNPRRQHSADLTPLLKPAPLHSLEAVEVGPYVNHSGNDGPQCIQPIPPNDSPPQQMTLF